MAPIPIATNFLAGSLISLLMPVGLLIALAVWYVIAVKRVPDDPSTHSPHAAGAAEAQGATDAQQGGSQASNS